MSWTHCVSDIPMQDWAFFRRVHAVTVDHQVFLFDYNKSREEDAMRVIVFDPRTHVFKVVQPDGLREASAGEARASKGEMVLLHFAVAFERKVYVCVGGRAAANAEELLVFDARRWRWGRVRTRGHAPSGAGRWLVSACEEDGHVYACTTSSDGAHLWALEMSCLRWKMVASAEWSGGCSPRCIVPYNNRIYVLLEILKSPLVFPYVHVPYVHDEITYFDLTTKTWERLQPPGPAPLALQVWIHFVYQGHLYVFLKDILFDDADLHKIYGNGNVNELVLRYSFAYNTWEQVCFKGIPPPALLHLACVVDKMGVFFSFNQKKAYVLDFFPSLRSLCYHVVSKYRLDSTLLPEVLKRELSMYNYTSNVFN